MHYARGGQTCLTEELLAETKNTSKPKNHFVHCTKEGCLSKNLGNLYPKIKGNR